MVNEKIGAEPILIRTVLAASTVSSWLVLSARVALLGVDGPVVAAPQSVRQAA
jgi:hypothetical protein